MNISLQPMKTEITTLLTVTENRHLEKWTRNSSADEIANVNFLRQHRTRTTK